MISTALKLMTFAVSVLITCSVIFVFFKAANEAKIISNNAIDQMSEMNNEISNSGIMMFDKSEVYGSEVVNFIKRNLGDYTTSENSPVYVFVKTSILENTYTNNQYITEIKNFTDSHYIKPTAKFNSEIVKNTNDVIVGVQFVQK